MAYTVSESIVTRRSGVTATEPSSRYAFVPLPSAGQLLADLDDQLQPLTTVTELVSYAVDVADYLAQLDRDTPRTCHRIASRARCVADTLVLAQTNARCRQ